MELSVYATPYVDGKPILGLTEQRVMTYDQETDAASIGEAVQLAMLNARFETGESSSVFVQIF